MYQPRPTSLLLFLAPQFLVFLSAPADPMSHCPPHTSPSTSVSNGPPQPPPCSCLSIRGRDQITTFPEPGWQVPGKLHRDPDQQLLPALISSPTATTACLLGRAPPSLKASPHLLRPLCRVSGSPWGGICDRPRFLGLSKRGGESLDLLPLLGSPRQELREQEQAKAMCPCQPLDLTPAEFSSARVTHGGKLIAIRTHFYLH